MDEKDEKVYNTTKNWCEHETREKRACKGLSSKEVHNKVLIGPGLSQSLIKVPDPAQESIREMYRCALNLLACLRTLGMIDNGDSDDLWNQWKI